jgi:hypothetical protein
VLLIGEQSACKGLDRPFCSTRGCSGWLNKQLDLERIPEERLFWLNALDNDDKPIDIKTIYEQLRPSIVIALGNVAKKVCIDQEIPHEFVYHPQYWKRFHSKERYPLFDLLKISFNEAKV